MRPVVRALVAAGLALCAWPLTAQTGTVKVNVARANVRAEASDKSPVLLQVTSGTELSLKAVEGDWYRVMLPPDPRLGGVRVEAFISKKVATLAAPSAAPVPPTPPAPVTSRDGMSVVLQAGDTTEFVTPEEARLRVVAPIADSLQALARVLPVDETPPASQGGSPVTYVWSVSGAAASRVLTTRRPAFIVQFKDVPGVAPDSLVPSIVRLTPTLSGVRLISAVRARADQATRTDTDWDLTRDLKQDAMRSTVQVVEPGAVRIASANDLEVGEYAVVLRPVPRRRLAGASVLGGADARVFTAVWTFAIR